MTGSELRRALRNGQTVCGTAMVSQSPLWPDMLAATGLDFVFIDTEHTPLGRESVATACRLYKAAGLAPIVRIPSPDPDQASMVLDAGASGVIAPYIESAEQVRQLVGAVRYKPLKGAMLQDFLQSGSGLDARLVAHLDNLNANNVLIANIESRPAIEALDEILAVDGLDGILVGPHDLTHSLGIPEQYRHPVFKQAINTIIEKARKKQVGVGVHVWDEVGFDQELEWAEKGANLIMHSNDLSLLSSALKADIGKLKKSTGTDSSGTIGANRTII